MTEAGTEMRATKVRDVMTASVRTVDDREELCVASDMMRALRIRHLVVLRFGKVAGILSQRDVSSCNAKNPGRHLHVAEAMRSPVTTIGPDDDLSEAAVRMAANRVGCLPVVQGATLLGIVTSTDVLLAAAT